MTADFYQFVPLAASVHSDTMNPPNANRSSSSGKASVKRPVFSLLAGLALLLLGVYFNRGGDGWHPHPQASAALARGLALVSPGLIVFGLALSLIGYGRLAWMLSTPAAKFSPRRLLLVIGTTMIVFGLCPWWWLSIATWLSGGRPGNEGEGMFGFLIFLFVGLPGLVLTLIGLLGLFGGNRK